MGVHPDAALHRAFHRTRTDRDAAREALVNLMNAVRDLPVDCISGDVVGALGQGDMVLRGTKHEADLRNR